MEQNIWSLFTAVAAAVPQREAVVWRDHRQSYAALAERAGRFATVLLEHGLGSCRPRAELANWECGQDLVGICLLNGPEYLEVQLGSYAARTGPFNVNYRYVAPELAHLILDSAAAAIVYHARFAPTIADAVERSDRSPLLFQVDDESGNQLLPGAIDYERALSAAVATTNEGHSPDDVYVLYTGGTTGMPKGVLWRHHDVWLTGLGGTDRPPDSTTEEMARLAASRAPDRVLPNAPLMHGVGQWTAQRALLNGDTVVINGIVERLDPVDVWTTVERERVRAMPFVGDAFARPLLEELETGRYDANSLEVISVGGAFTSPEIKARILAQLPHVLIADVAGSSESGAVLRTVTVAGKKVERGVFSPMPGAVVLDEDLRRPLEPGEDAVGWLAKRGAIPLGYLGDREKTERTFPIIDGTRWAVLGDRARLRDDGMIELLGRDSVTINSGGEKIFAEEVEAAVLSHPDVRDVIVVGRPSVRWGEEVVAVVELQAGASVEDADLLSAASTRIARYKLPKLIVRVDEAVRSPSGKADYSWARRIASDADKADAR